MASRIYLTRRYLVLFILPVLVNNTAAATLKIDLPEPEYILEFVMPPLSEREGLLLPEEQVIADMLWPLMDREEYTQAIQLLQQELPGLEKLPDMEIDIERYGILRPEVKKLRGEDENEDFIDPLYDLSPALIHVIGQIYLILEDYEKAEFFIRVAIVKLPDFIRAHQSLGLLYLLTERYEESRKHIVQAASLGGTNAALFGYLGYLGQQTGNPWGEVSAYQLALMLAFDNRQYQRGLLHGLVNARQYGSAMTLIDTLLVENTNDVELWLYRAHIALEMDQSETALTSLEVAIRLGDESYAHKQICAYLHLNGGSIARGIELLKASFIDGLDFEFVDQTLAWLVQQKQWDYAGDLIRGSRENWSQLDNIEKSRLLTHEAAIAQQNENNPEAIRTLQQAISLDPANADALINLADLYAREKSSVDAEILYERASAFENVRERALLGHAQLAIDVSDYPRAMSLLREAISHNPDRYELRENLRTLENLVNTTAEF